VEGRGGRRCRPGEGREVWSEPSVWDGTEADEQDQYVNCDTGVGVVLTVGSQGSDRTRRGGIRRRHPTPVIAHSADAVSPWVGLAPDFRCANSERRGHRIGEDSVPERDRRRLQQH
jgi:hypothetical protein